jgi:hypothetical protein
MDDPSTVVPLDDELWANLSAAVHAVHIAAETYLAGPNVWSPKVTMPKIGTFEGGWPKLDSRRYSIGEDGPVDLAALFGLQRDTLHPLAYSDVPELATLIDFAQNQPKIKEAFRIPGDEKIDAAVSSQLFAVQVAGLALSVLERWVALGTAATDLMAVYCEVERGVLQPTLQAELLVPLTLAALDLVEPLVVSDQVRIEPIDDPTQASRAEELAGIIAVPQPLVGAATHMAVVTGVELSNRPRWQRVWQSNFGELPLDEVDLLCEALRVVTERPIGFTQVLLRPLGWADRWVLDLPPLIKVSTQRSYPPDFDNYGWLRPKRHISADSLSRLPAVFGGLKSAPERTRLAARRLSLASLRSFADDQTIDACIGLEALLGKDRDELSHRLSLRAAAVLSHRAHDPLSAPFVYAMSKTGYDHRSAVVHGTNSQKKASVSLGDRTWPTNSVAKFLLRQLLLDQLERPTPWTPGSLDELVLKALNLPVISPTPTK